MAAETQYTANTGLNIISGANSSLTTGTPASTIWLILTAASNGTLIKTVTIKSSGTTAPSQGMVRLFISADSGSTFSLLKEIPVNPIKQGGTTGGPDITFERTIELDYKLKSGDSLYASTQNNDTFCVIAEGLDLSYFTSFVRPESTNYTANTGTASLTTASSTGTMTGAGSVLLLTANSNGTAVKTIRIKATAATSADGMIRIFIKSGSTYYLFKEIFVPYSNQGSTYKSFEYILSFPRTFQLQSGQYLYASTNNTDTFVVIAEGNDWSYPSGSLSNFTPVSVTGTLTETVLHAFQIPQGFLFSGGLFEVYSNLYSSAFAANKTIKIYANTVGTLPSGSKVTLATYTTNSLNGDNIARLFPVISDTLLECYGGTGTTTQNQYATTTGTSANSSTIPSISGGTCWIVIAATLGNTGDNIGARWSMIRKIF